MHCGRVSLKPPKFGLESKSIESGGCDQAQAASGTTYRGGSARALSVNLEKSTQTNNYKATNLNIDKKCKYTQAKNAEAKKVGFHNMNSLVSR